MRKRYNGSGGFSNFLSGLIGAILGGFLVFTLLGSSIKNSNNTIKSNNSNEKESVVNISPSDDMTMERAVVEKSINSVVGITTKTKATQNTIFGPQTGYVEGVGSGSIVTKDGYILTNSHVVDDGDAGEINVLLSNNKTLPAKLIWNDTTLDLAVIKVEENNLPAIALGDSDKVKVGDRSVAIGNPLGLELQSTVTSGIISGLNRTVSFQNGAQMDGLMQTDAAINSGNSGGALLNNKGELIGINTAKAGNSDGIGFAIPVNLAKTVIDEISKTGKFNSVYLGITGINLDLLLKSNNIDEKKVGRSEGVYIQSVSDNASDYFQKGDIITAIDDKKVKDMSSLKKILLNYRVGDSANISVIRKGKEEKIDFKFTLDSSSLDEYKEIKPKDKENSEKNEENQETLPDWLRP
ncbi:S1C family serine protease [Anaerococcus porci]|uniref:Trypsin-like serine protease n=1 Tax=Anaerococcus porci TaxID=2652269 RepID=A0A6N7VFN2_9FIRM|nr:trypsin-like peptidase domain-containing protein [Anaerococcus porci]MDY3006799.1 trypsin-like peptidase domain-containing protein [Anaerococcus porci]MSS78258.1 trypsin-like serine protease [Anaerococcus porci]